MTVTDQLFFSKNAVKEYIQKIEKLYNLGLANEESYYPDFKDLLKDFFNPEEYDVIVASRRERDEGKPDITVYMNSIPIINIEGKNPGERVDEWLKKESKNRLFEQIFRYRGGETSNIPVVITDFIRIWVVDKESPNSLESDINIKYNFNIVDDREENWKPFQDAKRNLENALHYTAEEIAFSITRVSSMIPHLVKYAKKLKDKIIEVFKEPSNPMKKYLENIRSDFLNSIFSSDKEKKTQEFADLFAQTLIYGGFIAWMRFCREGNSAKSYSFKKATDYLPYGTFIYDIFANMATKSSPDIKKSIFDKIERIFQSTEFEKITKNTESLMITFYSDFLWQYDPITAKDRGIVFTPHPIINFIVRCVDYFLKTYFEKRDGLRSSEISFLDPASGTMGFPCEILRIARTLFEIEYSNQPGRVLNKFKEWVQKSFLPNTYAFEILMAPYVLGHLRTNMLLDDLGYQLDLSREKINLYLFNTLMELQTTIKDFRNPTIGEEIVEALNIRNSKKILVVLSNPPYNISSQNEFEWIIKKVNYKPIYFEENEVKILKNADNQDEEILKIREIHNDYIWDLQREGTKEISGIKGIQDDYVKFIRFAQWKITQNKFGIVAFITNGYYIDGLIFRGMRSSLKKDFDMIWIVDLHGDARKSIPLSIQKKGIKKDENIFGIKPGVVIAFFVRLFEHDDNKCEVYYIDKWGLKTEKFEFLENNSIDTLKFERIPERLDHEFVPDLFELRKKYLEFIYLLDIFKKNVVGIRTLHDSLVSNVDREHLEKIIIDFYNGYHKKDYIILNGRLTYKKDDISYSDARDWSIEYGEKGNLEDAIRNIINWQYRGFDRRWIAYYEPLLTRGCHSYSLMQFLLPNQDNLTLIINRQSRGKAIDYASSVFISDTIFDNMCNEGPSGLHSYAFPLKINDLNEKDDFNEPKIAIDSNFRDEFKNSLKFESDFTDEDIFYYIYAILFAPSYRKNYRLGLMEDFPRIPFSKSDKYFFNLSKLGKRLTKLHLLTADDLNTTQFPMSKSSDYKIYYIRSMDKDDLGQQIPDTYDPTTKKIYFKKRTQSQIRSERKGNILNEITWIGGISQEMWDFQIGGRQQLKEWLYSRRYSKKPKKNHLMRALNSGEIEYFLKMCDSIKKTIELLPQIDEVYRHIDP